MSRTRAWEMRIAPRLGVWAILVALVTSAMLFSPFTARVVRGGSMSPALSSGDICVVRRGDGEIANGTIVLFRKPGWPGGVLHRVESVLPDGSVRTKGDANPVVDLDRVRRHDVLGTCVLTLPTGRVGSFLASLSGGRLRAQLHSHR